MNKDPVHLGQVLQKAHAHEGCSFVEIYQDCNIFNNGAFDEFAIKNNRSERTIVLEEGQPLLFGAQKEKALTRQGEEFVVVAGSDKNLFQHQPKRLMDAMRLAALSFPSYPVPLGIYYQQPRPVLSFQQEVKKSIKDLPGLYRMKANWQQI